MSRLATAKFATNMSINDLRSKHVNNHKHYKS